MARVGKPYGQAKAPSNYQDNSARSMISPGVYIGTVKKNDDLQYMGRLLVHIAAFGGDPENPDTWISVMYASPFAGNTSIFDQGSNVKEYSDTIKSYGWWATPPDIDARVLVAFADGGKLDKGYWFACLYQRGTQVSVPGIPAKNTWGGEGKPAAPKNRKDLDPDLEKYVEHKPMSNALKKQGLENDSLRGTTSSSATRETPSRVIGLLTPGQHQFVLDDGDKDGNNRLIRLRTTNGTQLLLDDVAGHIYMISKNGDSWVELSADGKIHLYGAADINIRSQGNINMYADGSVNIEAGQSINAKSNLGSIKLESGNEFSTFANTNTKITSVESSNINSGVGHFETAGVIHMNGPAADIHTPIDVYQLTVNQGITESICSIVPEHEPWAGHSGTINPVGHGNQQMQGDPAPDQTPRLPRTGEKPAPIIQQEPDEDALPAYKKLEEVKTSPEAMLAIKAQNGFSPINVQDGAGESGGFGTAVLKPETAEGAKPAAAPENTAGTQSPTGAPVQPAGEFKFTPEQEKWLGNANRQDPYILNRMPGPKPPVSYFKDPADQKLAKQMNFPGASQDASTNVNPFAGKSFTFDNLVQAGNYITQTAFAEFQKAVDASDALLGQPITRPPYVPPNPQLTEAQIQEILSKGIQPDLANQMFANDITENEQAVKRVLGQAGVKNIPQSVFDGLVSMQNQLGNINYAFVDGEKIDMTGLYKANAWEMAATFIAADERDRPRRIAEAAMIARNDYGPTVNEQNIIDKGMKEAAELLAKGKLNKQSGSPASPQQTVALATSYFAVTGNSLPSAGTPFKLAAAKTLAEENVVQRARRQAGPWPY